MPLRRPPETQQGNGESAPGEVLRSYLQQIAFRQLSLESGADRGHSDSGPGSGTAGRSAAATAGHDGRIASGTDRPQPEADGCHRPGDYRIEKIIYESLPRFYVTANLYVPQRGKPPYPAVLQPVGQSLTAKARAFYQTLGLGLVKNGFVVLTYDPVGQGERLL